MHAGQNRVLCKSSSRPCGVSLLTAGQGKGCDLLVAFGVRQHVQGHRNDVMACRGKCLHFTAFTATVLTVSSAFVLSRHRDRERTELAAGRQQTGLLRRHKACS